jgi:hypothetical protein
MEDENLSPTERRGKQVRRPQGGGESDAIEHILPSPPGLPAGLSESIQTFI